MNDQSNNQGLSGVFIGLGVLLMLLGGLFLMVQAVGFDLGPLAWPFFVIVPGLAVFGAGLAIGDPTGERITPIGAAVTTVGVILLYQNAADHFESWAYAWALVFDGSRAILGWDLFLRVGRRHQRIGDRFRPIWLALGAGGPGDTAAGRWAVVPAEVSP